MEYGRAVEFGKVGEEVFGIRQRFTERFLFFFVSTKSKLDDVDAQIQGFWAS